MDRELFPEEEIIEGCKKKKRYFQEVLYRRFAPKMYGVCMSYAKNREQAQDILHDSFMKIFRNIDTYKSQGSFEGWIRRIVTNTAIDFTRKKYKNLPLINEEIPEQEEFPDNEPELNMNELLEQVAKLPEGARMVFNLYTLQGMNHYEIAEKLNISVGTSKSQFSRARHLLQGWLKELIKKRNELS
ncbi:RNA polymerase sigma factor [Marinilabilia sp.]|uniref:RNA polymerase sigma factor n=1 Tax=Marinilabilia sp. TaxID=2021252 RepID=UPI0025BE44B3|nr:RNA polymerase sigma factor [Marinilabilia sp.]